MISKIDILKIVKKAVRRKQGTLDTRLVHPLRDWTIGLTLVALLFVASAVYAVYIFLDFSRSIDEPIHLESSIVIYKQEKAKEAFEIYRNRARQFELLRNDRSNIASLIIEEIEEEEPVLESLAEEGSEE